MADTPITPATLNLADKLAQFADHWNPRIVGAHDIVFGECDR